MLNKIRNWMIKHDRKVHRFLEIMPGTISWGIIIFYFIGSLKIPIVMAYLVILFDIYWFYKSATFAIAGIVSYFRIRASEKMDWLGEVKQFGDWKKVHHIVVLTNYKEPIHLLERYVQSLANQDFPTKQITLILAMEKREDEQSRNEKITLLKKKFGKTFANFIVTAHELVEGEVAGKSSNENFAVRSVKNELLDNGKIDKDFVVITSSDADHIYNSKHFSYLTFKFLDNPNRYLRFWQPAIFFYNNYWRLPALTRINNTFNTIWNAAVLSRTDRLINFSNYSLSFKLLDEVGYWDPNIIPEDYHIFFKSFFKMGGKVEVDSIYIPLHADAPESTTTWKTIKTQYETYKRWAWGVTDDVYVVKHYILTPGVSFWSKTIRLIRLVEDHILTPVNWFWITLGIIMPALLVPDFSRTVIGYTLPKISTVILNLCLVFMIVTLVLNAKLRPPRPENVSRLRSMLTPLEFILMPFAGFLFGVLPGLDAHTRLMLGKYIEYKVSEKR